MRELLANNDERRDLYVAMSSPELFRRDNKAAPALKRAVKGAYPVTKKAVPDDAERWLHQRVNDLLMPERDLEGRIEEAHHRNPLNFLGTARDKASSDGNARIDNLLEHYDVSEGNRGRNLLNLQHEDHDDIHNYARENGWEMQGKGTKGLALKLANAVNDDEIVGIVTEYLDTAVPALTARQDDLITARQASYDKARAFKSSANNPAELKNVSIDTVEDTTPIRDMEPDTDPISEAKQRAGARIRQTQGDRGEMAADDRTIIIDSGGGDVTINNPKGDDLGVERGQKSPRRK